MYSVILADPPWRYNSRANHKTRFRGGACGHYDLMTTQDICNLPIADLADENAVLFLWATFPMIHGCLQGD
jgi:site-specific DNA-methyltransferase (adenine-specific)